jgi:hypothetical protein
MPSRTTWCFRTAKANLTDTSSQAESNCQKADVEGAKMHRFRKTDADAIHEKGVSVNTI